jgi:hypothetical protein
MACVVLWWVDALPDPLAHMRASWLMTLSALASSLNRLGWRRRLAARRLHRVFPRRVTRLASNRGGISRLPVVVAGVLGSVVSSAFAWSSVALAVLRRAVVGRRSLSLLLVLASHDDVVLVSCAAHLSARLHRLLL